MACCCGKRNHGRKLKRADAVGNWARLVKKLKLIVYLRGLWTDMGILFGQIEAEVSPASRKRFIFWTRAVSTGRGANVGRKCAKQ